MNQTTENWREVVASEAAAKPNLLGGMRSAAEILAGMMRRGNLDGLDDSKLSDDRAE